MDNAIMAPMSTKKGFKVVANNAATICVLSPHSVRNMSTNELTKGFLYALGDSCPSPLFNKVSIPKNMKIDPDTIFK